MKSFLILIIAILNINCSSKNNILYYQGHVFTKDHKPAKGIEVSEKYQPSNKTFTDEKGFFKINKRENSISMFLILRKDKRIIDSIQIIRSSGGERQNYYFVDGRKDTIFIDLK